MTKEETISALTDYFYNSYDSIRLSDGDPTKLKGWVKYIYLKYNGQTGDGAIGWEDMCSQVVFTHQFDKWINYDNVQNKLNRGVFLRSMKHWLCVGINGYASSWLTGQQNKHKNEYNEATLSSGGDEDEYVFSVENFADETDETTSILKEPVAEEYEKTKLWTDVIEALRRNNIRALSRDDYLTLIKYKAENPKATLEQIHNKFGMNLSTMNNVQNRIRSDEIMIKSIKKNWGYLIPEDLVEQEKNWTVEELERRYNMPKNKGMNDGYVEQFKGKYKGSDHSYIIDAKTIKSGDDGYDEIYNAIKNLPDYGETIYYMQ